LSSLAWEVRRRTADAADLHQPPLEACGTRQVTLCRVSRPALVLGSTQAEGDADLGRTAAAGIAVSRRRSGGGAVLVVPGQLVWAEVRIERADPLWEADVGRAFWWLGNVWAAALVDLGVGGVEVHRGGLVATGWSSVACFAGLGPGEVTVGAVKVVGLSQRRTREATTFSCAALLDWEPGDLLELLALSPEQRVEATACLSRAATGLRALVERPVEMTVTMVEDAFLGRLGRLDHPGAGPRRSRGIDGWG